MFAINLAEFQNSTAFARVREGGEATRFFCIVNCDSRTVVVVAHFDPHLAGRRLSATGRADDCFCHL